MSKRINNKKGKRNNPPKRFAREAERRKKVKRDEAMRKREGATGM